MKKATLLSLFLSCAAHFSTVLIHPADAAEVRVTGMIVPDACQPTFSDGGVIDYGQVISSEQGSTKILSKKTVSLSVSCALPARIAIRLIDNRESAGIPHMQAVAARHRDTKHIFGLGAQSGKNAGGYIVSFEPQHPAEVQTSFLESASNINATHWTLSSDNAIRKNVLYSWDAEHKIHPGGTLNFQTTLGIHAIIDSSAKTQDKDDAQLDGSATFELLYL